VEEWSSYAAHGETETTNEGGDVRNFGDEEVVFRESVDAFIGEMPPSVGADTDPAGDSLSVRTLSSSELYFPLSSSSVSSFYSFRSTSPKRSSMVHTLCPAISLRMDSFDPRSKDFKSPLPNALRVRIISACDLPTSDHIGFSSNPRCHLYWMGELLHQTKGLKEKREERRDDPSSASSTEWNDTFDLVLDVDDLLYGDLRIEIVDVDLGVYSDSLGQIAITGDEILECAVQPQVWTIITRPI
jgi:hypothetical protein